MLHDECGSTHKKAFNLSVNHWSVSLTVFQQKTKYWVKYDIWISLTQTILHFIYIKAAVG